MHTTDYNLIAAAIGRRYDAEGRGNQLPASAARGTINRLAIELANALKDENPRFDKRLFLVACGIDS